MAAFIDTIATILVFGLAYAMLLFIISVGLSITMGLMGFVNLAHGAFAMVGGYLTVTLVTGQGVGFIPALIVAFVVGRFRCCRSKWSSRWAASLSSGCSISRSTSGRSSIRCL